MKIFIDFDDVLFETKKFVNDFDSIFIGNGISKDKIKEFSKSLSETSKCKKTPYSLEREINFFKKTIDLDYDKLSGDAESFMENLKKYVFSDVDSFLKSFPKKDLYLLSYGDVNFQKKKIINSGIGKYFGKIIISEDNKLDVISKIYKDYKFSKNEKIILIDDRVENLEKIEKKHREIITFLMLRPERRHKKPVRSKIIDFKVKNLKEAAKIIKKEKLS